MDIIDFRCRPPFKPFLTDWIFSIADKPGNPGLGSKYEKMGMTLPQSLVDESMEEFFSEQDACSIVKTVVPLRRLPNLDNDCLKSLLETWPEKFIGFAGIQPAANGIGQCIAEIEKYVIDGPCAGVYMEPGLDFPPWAIDDKTFFPVYEVCEKNNLPVCFLFGGIFHKNNPPAYDYYNPARLENVARRFPDMRIAISHACWPFTAHACAVALNYKNIWLSPDGFMINQPGCQDYILAANYRLQDRIIFGSLYSNQLMKITTTFKPSNTVQCGDFPQRFRNSVIQGFFGSCANFAQK